MRRWYAMSFAVLTAAHLYIWWRLVLPLPSPWLEVGTVVVALGGPSFPVTQRVARRRSRADAQPWLLVGYVWFGFAIYFVLGLLHVARGPLVRRVRVPIAKLSAPIKIVQLTDVHIGNIIGEGFVEKMVRRTNALKPDLIVITGDLVDGHLSELRRHAEPLRHLRARHGVYYVTGNHEYYWGVDGWLSHLRSLGLRVLRNEHVEIERAITLAGTDDSSRDEDVPAAVAGRDPDLPVVLLAHHPRTIERAVAAGVDLQLSGHTHGGQLLPWGYFARIWDPKVAGLKRFDRTWLYVNQGTGFWGPPLRVGTSCEITELTLTPS